jgi:hypothetical protein
MARNKDAKQCSNLAKKKAGCGRFLNEYAEGGGSKESRQEGGGG